MRKHQWLGTQSDGSTPREFLLLGSSVVAIAAMKAMKAKVMKNMKTEVMKTMNTMNAMKAVKKAFTKTKPHS